MDFKAVNGAAFFNVVPPGSTSEALFVGMNEGNHYSGTLPKDGDYIIRVYQKGGAKDTGKPVKYTLKLGIPASGKTGGAAGKVSETSVAEKACLDAVAKQVGKDKILLKVSDVFSSEAGSRLWCKSPKPLRHGNAFLIRKARYPGLNSPVRKARCKRSTGWRFGVAQNAKRPADRRFTGAAFEGRKH